MSQCSTGHIGKSLEEMAIIFGDQVNTTQLLTGQDEKTRSDSEIVEDVKSDKIDLVL